MFSVLGVPLAGLFDGRCELCFRLIGVWVAFVCELVWFNSVRGLFLVDYCCLDGFDYAFGALVACLRIYWC